MEEEITDEQDSGGSLIKKLIGILAIFGTVFAALFWWRRRGSGDDTDSDEDAS